MRLTPCPYLVVLLALLMFPGCRKQSMLSPYHWPSIGGEFDSLTVKLENQFNEYAPYDSIGASISRMEELSLNNPALHHVMNSRTLYWKGRFMMRLENTDSALILLNRGIRCCDSIKYRYDFLRLRSSIYNASDSIAGSELFRHFDECLCYARKIDDKAFEAFSAINMANLLGEVGAYNKALEYFHTADSLNINLGFNKLPVKNKINIARVIGQMGDQEQEARILKSLIGNSALDGDTFVTNLVMRNLFAATQDTRFLYRAYHGIKDCDRFRHLRGLYAALIARHCYDSNRFDSVLYYSNIAHDDLKSVKNYAHKAIIWHSISLGWAICNRFDSALVCRTRYEMYSDSMLNRMQISEVLRMSTFREIEKKDAEHSASIQIRNIIIVAVSGLLLAFVILVYLFINRRRIRHRMEAIAAELDLEKTRRKIAATTLTIEEKDKVLESVKEELSDMRKSGEIKESHARRLETTIKSHLVENESSEVFQEMFDVVHPKFVDKLREICPNLADSYIRLACYLVMELDSYRIARLMMIKNESVRQAKWRLRQRLSVPADQTLEEFLRVLNKSDPH